MSECFRFESSHRQRAMSAASAAQRSAGFSRPWLGLLPIEAREISEPVRFLISAARLGGLVSKNESSS